MNILSFNKITPSRIAIYGIFLYGLIFLIAPIETNTTVNLESIAFILLCYIFFIAGALLNKKRSMIHKKLYSVKKIQKIFLLTYYISLAGIILKIYDRFFIRGLSLFQLIFENRELAESGSGNFFAIAGSIIFLTSLFPLFLSFLQPKGISRFYRITSYFFFFYLSFDSILQGGRFGVLINIFIFLLYLLYFQKIKLNTKSICTISLLSIILISSISALWFSRLNEMNMDIYWSMENSGYAHTVPPTRNYLNVLSNNENNIAVFSTLFVFGHFSQYYLHGIFEFMELFEHISFTETYSFGSNIFSIIFKFMNKIQNFNFSMENISNLYHTSGLYTTFFGPLYVDFGWFGHFFMFAFGWFQKFIWFESQEGDPICTPFYFYLIMITLFMPVVNLLMGNGIYALSSFLIIMILKKLI